MHTYLTNLPYTYNNYTFNTISCVCLACSIKMRQKTAYKCLHMRAIGTLIHTHRQIIKARAPLVGVEYVS